MSNIEQLNKIKEQNTIRAKRHYDLNKQKIADRRKIARNKCKELLNALGIENTNEPVSEMVMVEEIKDAIQEQIPLVPIKSKKAKKATIITLTTLTQEEKKINKFNNDQLKTLSVILNCSDWDKCFKISKNVIYKIESAFQIKRPTTLYSINSKKSFYQAILTTITNKKIKVSENALKEYNDKLIEYKLKSHLESEEKKKTKVNIDFNEYVKKVIDFYGKDSKQALIIALYELHVFRDDLVLQIIPKQIKDISKNYLIVPEKKTNNLTLILNTYKTDKKYGQELIPIPRILSKDLRKYINTNDLKYNDYLFGKTKLTKYIRTFNEKLGLKISINNLRQMKASKVLNNNPTIEERLILAKEMKHMPITSEKYKTLIV